MRVAESSVAEGPCADGAVVLIERPLLAIAAAVARSCPTCAKDAVVALKPLSAGTGSMSEEAGELAGLVRLGQSCRTKFACGRGWLRLLPPHYLVVKPA